MASKNFSNNDWKIKFFKLVMPKVYGIGASIVIAGAMFKLLNWPGGALMLGLGLTTEAIIFFLASFEPQAKELDWTKVYPELLEDGHTTSRVDSLGEKLDDMFAKARIDANLVERLGQGMQYLADSVTQITNLSTAAISTERYTINVEKATNLLEGLNGAYSGVAQAMHSLVTLSKDTKDYQEQMRNIVETLSQLNLSYKNELQEGRQRTQITQDAYENINAVMLNMQKAGEETEQFKTELSQLNEKISSLNSLYGNMLTALRG